MGCWSVPLERDRLLKALWVEGAGFFIHVIHSHVYSGLCWVQPFTGELASWPEIKSRCTTAPRSDFRIWPFGACKNPYASASVLAKLNCQTKSGKSFHTDMLLICNPGSLAVYSLFSLIDLTVEKKASLQHRLVISPPPPKKMLVNSSKLAKYQTMILDDLSKHLGENGLSRRDYFTYTVNRNRKKKAWRSRNCRSFFCNLDYKFSAIQCS